MTRRVSLGLLLLVLVAAPAAAQDQIATGTITSTTCPGTGCVSLVTAGSGSGALQVTAIGSQTLQFEGSVDGTTFANLVAFPAAGGGGVSSTTTNGIWVIGTAGYAQVRVRGSAYASGTAVITIRLAPGSQVVAAAIGAWLGSTAPTVGQKTMANALPVVIASDQTPVTINPNGGSLNVTQGNSSFDANAGWTVAITDYFSGNGPVGVAQASAPVTAAQQSLAVGLSPNSPLPAGANPLGSIIIHSSLDVPITATGAALDVNLKSSSVSPLPVSGTVTQIDPSVASVATTFVGTAVQETTLLAANGSRKALSVLNQSNRTMLLCLCTGIGSQHYTATLAPGRSFSLGLNGPMNYTGAVTGLWFGLDGGGAVITEM